MFCQVLIFPVRLQKEGRTIMTDSRTQLLTAYLCVWVSILPKSTWVKSDFLFASTHKYLETGWTKDHVASAVCDVSLQTHTHTAAAKKVEELHALSSTQGEINIAPHILWRVRLGLYSAGRMWDYASRLISLHQRRGGRTWAQLHN